MIVIRRYPNRKLYANGAYVSLEYVETLRRAGKPFKIWDLIRNEDITNECLFNLASMKLKKLSREKQSEVVDKLFAAFGE